MSGLLHDFTHSEDGATTVDFVVLTGGVIALALAVTIPAFGGAIGWGELLAGLIATPPMP